MKKNGWRVNLWVVELEGFEPSSKQAVTLLSTCLAAG